MAKKQKKSKIGKLTMTLDVEIDVTWKTVLKMRLMGRYPAAIIARAVADRIRAGM